WALEPSYLRGAGPSTTLELPRVSYSSPAQPPCVGVHLGEREGRLLLFVSTGQTAVQSTRPSWSPWEGTPLGRRLMIDFILSPAVCLGQLDCRGRLGTLSPSGPCSLPPLSTCSSLKLWTQGVWCLSWRQPLNPVVDTGSKGCRQKLKKESYQGHVGLWDSRCS
ncbi:hypothetical protein L3Q82_011204, partial [Scortum barcoo]